MVQIIDDLFTDKFLLEIYEDLLTGWSFDNVANRYQHPMDSFCKGTHRFFSRSMYEKISKDFAENQCPDRVMEVYEVLSKKIENDLNIKLEVTKIEANLQVMLQDGTPHIDGTSHTLIFFPHYKWEKEWGGYLQIFDNEGNLTESILPLPGRAVLFDSRVLHRGLSPVVPNIARISIAYRVNCP